MKNTMDIEGKNVLIRTVTNYYTGEVTEETSKFLRLSNAAAITTTSARKYGLVEIEEFVSHDDYDRFEIGDVYR